MSLFWSRMHLDFLVDALISVSRSHDGACVHIFDRSDHSFRANAEAHTVALILLKPLVPRHD